MIYNDLVFQYLQKIHQLAPDQGQCLVYLGPDNSHALAFNVQKVLALQEKYPEVKFDVALRGVQCSNYSQRQFEKMYYFRELNIVTDTPNSASTQMQRDDFSFYLYNQALELVTHAVGLQQLEQDIVERWKIVEPRTSMYDAQISDNDKSLIIKGFYMPYLRRVYNRSKNKDLVIVYMDGEDDRFNAYLKQLDECQQKFTECYLVLLVT